MKKLLSFCYIVSFVLLQTQAQLVVKVEDPCEEIQRVNSIGYPIILTQCDGYYNVMFRNTSYQHIVEMESFNIYFEDVVKFKEVLLSSFDKGERIELELNGETVILDFHSGLGVINFRFMYFVSNAYFATSSFLNKKKTEKLFESM